MLYSCTHMVTVGVKGLILLRLMTLRTLDDVFRVGSRPAQEVDRGQTWLQALLHLWTTFTHATHQHIDHMDKIHSKH